MLRVLFEQASNSPSATRIPLLFDFSLLIYIIYGLAIWSGYFLYKTVTGLRMRAVGEYPLAADTVGISVAKVRYFGVVMSGVFAGLGGTYLAIGALSQFSKEMSAGRGFIALAALVLESGNQKVFYLLVYYLDLQMQLKLLFNNM